MLLALVAVGAVCSSSSPDPKADPGPHPAPHPDAVLVQLPAHGGEEGHQLEDEDSLPSGVRRCVGLVSSSSL